MGRLWLYDVKCADGTDGGTSVSKREKMVLALAEMQENMEEIEARLRAKEELKKW